METKMVRTYTVTTFEGVTIYEGFNRHELPLTPLIAIVQDEGVREVFYLDDCPEAKVDFERFIMDQGKDFGPCRLVGYYRKEEQQ